ncbi:hypothetical protein ACH42_09475 [Endozoicomonas sp. (ex Bugula neritina AB1)]|nr:hypothetical protein ACH42_09475 [Endozoicomonas sp. (ex Bugula neritina AB1)]
MSKQATSVRHAFSGLASLVIIIAGIKLGDALVAPLLLSLFITLLIHPVVEYLARFHIPRILGITFTLTAFVLFMVVFVGIIGQTSEDFSAALPGYKEQLVTTLKGVQVLLTERGIQVDLHTIATSLDSSSLVGLFTDMLGKLGSTMSYMLLILLMVVFMLIEAPILSNKIKATMKNSEHTLPNINRFVLSFNRYIALKTIISFITGLLVTAMLWIKGVNFYVLWGLMAFLMNFIPNIGSILAAIPGVLLTLLQLGGADALIISAGYISINIIIGNVLEPKIMGQGLGLSPLVVFLSLIIWGWLLGPVGMLLSVPLTICIRIMMESSTYWKKVAILLGPELSSDALLKLSDDTSK